MKRPSYHSPSSLFKLWGGQAIINNVVCLPLPLSHNARLAWYLAPSLSSLLTRFALSHGGSKLMRWGIDIYLFNIEPISKTTRGTGCNCVYLTYLLTKLPSAGLALNSHTLPHPVFDRINWTLACVRRCLYIDWVRLSRWRVAMDRKLPTRRLLYAGKAKLATHLFMKWMKLRG